MNNQANTPTEPQIKIENLTMAYGKRIIQQQVNFSVNPGTVFIIMGGSGCGKSTLLNHMIGLQNPRQGDILYNNVNFWKSTAATRSNIKQEFGVLFQHGALWSSMTLLENIMLSLQTYTDLSYQDSLEIAEFKLAVVGLAGFGGYYPSELSGGMQKRAGLARAMALDPKILFFDEPSTGLDPVTSRRLDQLILEIRNSFGTTIIVVTHELSSIFAIGDDAIFLDSEEKTIIAQGNPKQLAKTSKNQKVRNFLNVIK